MARMLEFFRRIGEGKGAVFVLIGFDLGVCSSAPAVLNDDGLNVHGLDRIQLPANNQAKC